MDWQGDYHTEWSKSDRERQISYDISYMESKYIYLNELIYKTETKKTHSLREWTYGYQQRRDRNVGIDMYTGQFSSVSRLRLFATPWHARPPCTSPTPGIHPNPCPLSQWCYPTISSSVIPFSSYPWSFPASGSLQMSQLFASGGQSIGAAASTSVIPMNSQDWSSLEWTGWTSLLSNGLLESSPKP